MHLCKLRGGGRKLAGQIFAGDEQAIERRAEPRWRAEGLVISGKRDRLRVHEGDSEAFDGTTEHPAAEVSWISAM
jgi:hypothetical protein